MAVAVLLVTSVAPATTQQIIKLMIQGSYSLIELSSQLNHLDNPEIWKMQKQNTCLIFIPVLTG